MTNDQASRRSAVIEIGVNHLDQGVVADSPAPDDGTAALPSDHWFWAATLGPGPGTKSADLLDASLLDASLAPATAGPAPLPSTAGSPAAAMPTRPLEPAAERGPALPASTDPALPASTGPALPASTGPVSPGMAARRIEPPPPYGWVDVLTGTDGPRMWERLLASEQARNERHARTATVAYAELAGFDAAATRWGRDLATRGFVRLSQLLLGGIRLSDFVARIGPTRFGVLLTETDEILAINFVDRVRAQCDVQTDPASRLMRVVIGWASPPAGGRLEDAASTAQQRLDEALRAQP